MSLSSFALFGAQPLFEKPLPIGQLYFPSWQRYEAACRGIFARQYYNNNGPLLGEFEGKLRLFLKVKHAICVANATLGLMMAVDAMHLTGKVIVPAFTFIASVQAISWAGLEPVFCDIHPETHQIDIGKIEALIGPDVSAIMGVNLWGGSCLPKELLGLATVHGLKVCFDSAHAFGSTVDGLPIGNFGDAEVFSFHATKVLSAMAGGCICTNDDELAARLRSIRPSYGSEMPVSIVRVANARMSEAQAAVGLMSLEDFPSNQKNNAALFELYKAQIASVPGLRLLAPSGVSFSNYQYAVCMVDEGEFGISRDLLIKLLKAENVVARRYFYPGAHRSVPYGQEFPQFVESLPNTDAVCASVIQFPIGTPVTSSGIEKICQLLHRIQIQSRDIRAALKS
jgi:dTDP-4-amino-4,6-dideoxygalactose transaminase